MKRHLLQVLLVTMTLCATLAFSQEAPSSNPSSGRWGRGDGSKMTPEARLDRMSKHLKLSDDQKQKIRPILEEQNKQAQALRDDTSLSQDDRRARFEEIRRDTQAKIRPILNEEQQKKLDEMQQKRRERMEHGGTRGD